MRIEHFVIDLSWYLYRPSIDYRVKSACACKAPSTRSTKGISVSATSPKRQLGQPSAGVPSEPRAVYERIARVISELRYGTVEITIHDGRVVQIERTEKIRVPSDPIAGLPE